MLLERYQLRQKKGNTGFQSCTESVSVCRNGKSTTKQFRPSKQWHGANETLSEAGLNCRLVFIFGAEKSSKKYVCVCVLGGVCVRGWGVWLGGRAVWERGAWGLPRSCYLGCSSTAGGEREASGGNQVKGWRDWCTTPFSFLPNFHSRFFLFCFASFNRVSKREGEGYRERVKEKIKPIFLKTRSWLSYKQMLPVIWLLSRHIDRTILRVYWLAFSYLWFYYKENRSLTNMGIIFFV